MNEKGYAKNCSCPLALPSPIAFKDCLFFHPSQVLGVLKKHDQEPAGVAAGIFLQHCEIDYSERFVGAAICHHTSWM